MLHVFVKFHVDIQMQTENFKRYSDPHPLYVLFFSKSLTGMLPETGKGLCLTYLLLAISINLIPDMVRLQDRVDGFLTDDAPKVVRQVPTVTISKGTASIQEPVPFVIHAPWSTLPFAIIDTSDRTSSPADEKATILLTKTKLTVKSDMSEMHSLDLSKIEHLVVDQNMIYSWIESFKHYFIFAVFPLALFLAFLYDFAQVLLCSWIAKLFVKMFDLSLTFRALAVSR